jgi:hypothetical protein
MPMFDPSVHGGGFGMIFLYAVIMIATAPRQGVLDDAPLRRSRPYIFWGQTTSPCETCLRLVPAGGIQRGEARAKFVVVEKQATPAHDGRRRSSIFEGARRDNSEPSSGFWTVLKVRNDNLLL